MKVLVAENGYCWGIDLALKRMAEAARKEAMQATHRWSPKPAARAWDPLEAVRRRDAELINLYPGLDRVDVVENLAGASASTLALGHHGTEEDKSKTPARTLLDFTCPFIAKLDQRAVELVQAGHDLVLYGKAGNHHCESAKAVAERAGRAALIAEKVADIAEQLRVPGRNWACLGQVTADVEAWQAFKDDLAVCGSLVKIMDTVCTDSHERQAEAVRLARKADVVIVVNDHGGASQSVFEQCVRANPRTYRFDAKADAALRPEWLADAEVVAVVGGIHVPAWELRKVAALVESPVSVN